MLSSDLGRATHVTQRPQREECQKTVFEPQSGRTQRRLPDRKLSRSHPVNDGGVSFTHFRLVWRHDATPFLTIPKNGCAVLTREDEVINRDLVFAFGEGASNLILMWQCRLKCWEKEGPFCQIGNLLHSILGILMKFKNDIVARLLHTPELWNRF